MEDHMVLVVPAAHEWANHEVSLANLKTQPLLMREFGSGSWRVVEQALAAAGLKNEGNDNKYVVGLDRRLAKCRRGGTRRHIRFVLGCAKPACAWNSKACTRSGTEAIPPVLLGVSCRTGTCRECGRIPEFPAQPGTRSLSEARCCCGARSFEKGLIHFSSEFR
jgi:hypothetical protein